MIRHEMGLRTKDIIERIKTHRKVNYINDRMLDLKISTAAPKRPKSRLLTRMEEMIATRKTENKRSVLDLQSTIH